MRLVLLLSSIALLASCAPPPVIAPEPQAEVRPGGCRIATDADFEGAGEQHMRSYLAWLVKTEGARVQLGPRDAALAIVRGAGKLAPSGVQIAEVGCSAKGAAPYRVTLYRDALVGRPLATSYHAIAHEFHHVVQIRKESLPCGPGEASRHPYERQADAVADRLVPACKGGSR